MLDSTFDSLNIGLWGLSKKIGKDNKNYLRYINTGTINNYSKLKHS
jgi:hypothetical protein